MKNIRVTCTDKRKLNCTSVKRERVNYRRLKTLSITILILLKLLSRGRHVIVQLHENRARTTATMRQCGRSTSCIYGNYCNDTNFLISSVHYYHYYHDSWEWSYFYENVRLRAANKFYW